MDSRSVGGQPNSAYRRANTQRQPLEKFQYPENIDVETFPTPLARNSSQLDENDGPQHFSFSGDAEREHGSTASASSFRNGSHTRGEGGVESHPSLKAWVFQTLPRAGRAGMKHLDARLICEFLLLIVILWQWQLILLFGKTTEKVELEKCFDDSQKLEAKEKMHRELREVEIDREHWKTRAEDYQKEAQKVGPLHEKITNLTADRQSCKTLNQEKEEQIAELKDDRNVLWTNLERSLERIRQLENEGVFAKFYYSLVGRPSQIPRLIR